MALSEDLVQQAWEKATIVAGYDIEKWRKDQCKAWIAREGYGYRESEFGWEIDHIKPESEGGTDDLSNLRPLQWQNNAHRLADRLVCVVTSFEAHNTGLT